MEIGCGLVCQEDIPLAGQIGFDYVELMGKQLAKLNYKEVAALAGTLGVSGLVCRGINGYCPPEIVIAGPGFDLEKIRRYARNVAIRAKEIGTSLIGIGSPKSRILPEGYSREKGEEQIADFLKATAEEMDRYGIHVCLEALAPCYCNFINHVQEASKILESVGRDSVGLVLDFYNMELVGEADMDLRPWIKSIVHGHISDDAASPYKRYFLKKEKTVIHQERIRRLKEAGYKGGITLEIDVPLDVDLAQQSLTILRNAV